MNCRTCGKETKICYSNEGTLAIIYGWCQCKECYSKEHSVCVCGTFLADTWKFCPICGKQVNHIERSDECV